MSNIPSPPPPSDLDFHIQELFRCRIKYALKDDWKWRTSSYQKVLELAYLHARRLGMQVEQPVISENAACLQITGPVKKDVEALAQKICDFIRTCPSYRFFPAGKTTPLPSSVSYER
jgi:hypothetical protein